MTNQRSSSRDGACIANLAAEEEDLDLLQVDRREGRIRAGRCRATLPGKVTASSWRGGVRLTAKSRWTGANHHARIDPATKPSAVAATAKEDDDRAPEAVVKVANKAWKAIREKAATWLGMLVVGALGASVTWFLGVARWAMDERLRRV